jgi:peptidoglycan-associated lipoprotein
MKTCLFLLVVAAAAFLLASCAPPAGYDIAKQNALDAQDGAKAIHADELCPDLWTSAEQNMKKAMSADADKDYNTAKRSFEQAKDWYDTAKRCAFKKTWDVCTLPPPPPPPPGWWPIGGPHPAKLDPIFFDYDTYNIRPDQIGTAKADASKFKNGLGLVGHKFQLTGWCDTRGNDEYNLALGERRANAVYQFLTASGVPATQLEIKSGGKTTKFSAETTEEGYQLNRRVAFVDLGNEAR